MFLEKKQGFLLFNYLFIEDYKMFLLFFWRPSQNVLVTIMTTEDASAQKQIAWEAQES